MFITIEGIDGVGKTSIIELLKKHNPSIITTREPGGCEISEQIRKLLLDNNTNICNITELLLFQAARVEFYNNIIKPIRNNNIIISDRYYGSTFAYQGYGRGIAIDKIEQLINLTLEQEAHPDLTFLVLRNHRLINNKFNKDRIESTIDFKKVEDGYVELAIKYNWNIINNDTSLINVANQIERVIYHAH
jgi:dTMP kinase